MTRSSCGSAVNPVTVGSVIQERVLFVLVKAKIEAVSQARTEEVLRSLDSLAIWVLAHGLCSHFKNQIITNEERVLMRGLITLQYLRNERVHGLPANDGFDETVAQSGWKTLLDSLHWMKAVHLRQVPTYKTL